MHPALSVILFTTASGAGYGLLFAGRAADRDELLAGRAAGSAVAAFGLSLGAITFGLLSSTFHLGHPERAWRAFSQWRTSWLSREGVASVIAYLPAGLLALDWVFRGQALAWLGWLTALLAAITVYCTAMIYASLKPIPRWHHPWVPPNYLLLGLMTGAPAAAGPARPLRQAAGAGLLVHGCHPRRRSRREARLLARHRPRAGDEHRGKRHRPGRARPGAPARGAPYRGQLPDEGDGPQHRPQARRQAAPSRHRRGIRAAAAAEPALPRSAHRWRRALAAVLAAVSGLCGVLLERWLFFAEAKHSVTLYYGAAAV